MHLSLTTHQVQPSVPPISSCIAQFNCSVIFMALTLDSEEECLAQCQSTGRALVSMTTSQGDRPLGTMLLQLFSDICPHTCGNFLKLVKGEAGSGMKNTPIHRIVPKAFIQVGHHKTLIAMRTCDMWMSGVSEACVDVLYFLQRPHLQARMCQGRIRAFMGIRDVLCYRYRYCSGPVKCT